jgi:hypothetical protein
MKMLALLTSMMFKPLVLAMKPSLKTLPAAPVLTSANQDALILSPTGALFLAVVSTICAST